MQSLLTSDGADLNGFTSGAKISTNTMVGVPFYKYSIVGPKTLF